MDLDISELSGYQDKLNKKIEEFERVFLGRRTGIQGKDVGVPGLQGSQMSGLFQEPPGSDFGLRLLFSHPAALVSLLAC